MVQSILWRNLDEPGAERVVIRETMDGWRFTGTVLIGLPNPTEIRYDLLSDANWLTRSVHVEVDDNGTPGILDLRVEEQTWVKDGVPLDLGPDVLDVDLGVSPLTNTLPIRRLGLAMGQSSTIAVAWVRFPGLTVERSEQGYERIGDLRYRFRDADFTADLEVDNLGFVVEYPGGWTRAATSSP